MFRRHRSRDMRVVALSMPPFVRICCLVIAFILLPVWWYASRPSQGRDQGFRTLGKHGLGRGSKHRLAIIIPFIGKDENAIPPYLEIFCNAATGSASLVDFLLIHNGVLDGYHGDACPANVIFISLGSNEDFVNHLMRVVDHKEDKDIALGGSRTKMTRIVANYIFQYPYVLVEFKPALGYIFSDFLQGYSHWGYSDLDILFGDLERWITPDELNDFDIVTYGFGDQDRVYLRGQFTFHRNDPKINTLWRRCKYLSEADQRFADVIADKTHLKFESAEGCYSDAVLQRNDIKIKYAVKAFTDIDESDTAYSHGLFVGTGTKKTKTVLYKAGSKADGKALERIPDTWFEKRDSIYRDTRKPLQYEVGEREKIPLIEKTDAKCMFWAQKQYQSRLCLDHVESTDTVFWIDGQLYKQKYQIATLPGKILTAPFFHFQEWKRYYRSAQLASFHRSGPVRSFVMTKEGVLPIYPQEFRYDKRFTPSPLGISTRKWTGIALDDRSQLPNRSYCLRSGPKLGPNPPSPQCRLTASWRDSNRVKILSKAPLWNQVDVSNEVTMVLTLQMQYFQVYNDKTFEGLMSLVETYLNRWQGQPCVIVLHISNSNSIVESKISAAFGSNSDLSSFGMDTILVGAIFSEENEFFSRKALLNMAIDAVPTRWYISGFELERGMVMSPDTAFFAHRVAKIHEELPGSVFVVPQFGLATEESDFALPSLWAVKNKSGAFKALAKLDEGSCEGNGDHDGNGAQRDIFDPLYEMWWEMSKIYIPNIPQTQIDDSVHEQRALALDSVQMSIISLLTEKKHYDLFSMDVSPILLTDNLGARDGMTTAEIAREVEEFGGKQCYNGLRLAQLATYGYTLNVLPGAFAISTPKTRKVAFADTDREDSPLGASRCDACFLFDEKHEDILEDISRDERKRPAKTALLWERSTNLEPLFGHT